MSDPVHDVERPAASVVDRPVQGTGRRPDLRFMLAHPAHVVALGFGSGLSRIAPGTAGTLFAWIAWLGLAPVLGDRGIAILLAATFAASWWSATLTARHLGSADPSAIVCDEIVAFWLILWLVPATLGTQAVAFVVFRFFDAAKPGPVAWADQRFKEHRGRPIGWRQGFGVVFDDLVAALCTLLVFALWRFVSQGWR